MKHILVTGGCGYIGSHTVLELLNQGYNVTVFDSLERGYQQSLSRIHQLTGKEAGFCQGDLRNPQDIQTALSQFQIDAVIHFAAYKSVGEAQATPEAYYQNNVMGTLNLLQAMHKHQVNNIVFSSTSAVYGESDILPMHEALPFNPKNAYGKSKATVEWILEDFYNAHQISSIALRYFNAAGAHPSGQIGEDPSQTGNIIPLIMQTLVGKREKFTLYGNNHSTSDGTQERDYIHVMDLATGHLAALKKLETTPGASAYNLGTGNATSNQTLIALAEKITNKKLNYEVLEPRPGDPPITVCDPSKAQQELGWKATATIEDILTDNWNWVTQNPQGYQ